MYLVGSIVFFEIRYILSAISTFLYKYIPYHDILVFSIVYIMYPKFPQGCYTWIVQESDYFSGQLKIICNFVILLEYLFYFK